MLKTFKREEVIRDIIGARYVNGTFASENSAEVQAAFKEISKINRILFEKIPYKVVFTKNDAYSSAKEMRQAVQETGVIEIYTVFGGHPFLDQESNNIGRAVHDVFAHLVCGCPFSFVGEYNAYREQRKYYPMWTWDVLFAEIPAQTAAYYYTGSFDYQQRAFAAPKEWNDMCETLITDYSANSIMKPMSCTMKELGMRVYVGRK